MNELNNNNVDNTEEVKPIKDKVVKPKSIPSSDGLEAWIIAKSDAMNIPALAAYFGVGEDVIKQALAKK